MALEEGSLVEVSMIEEGLKGSWYTARLLKEKPEGYKVRYQNLRLSEDPKSPKLVEVVEKYRVRPHPGFRRFDTYDVGTLVDVNENDGWWEGKVVKKVNRGREYDVWFIDYGTFRYPVEKLRPARLWLNGRFFGGNRGGGRLV